jgi:hypothetical protein
MKKGASQVGCSLLVCWQSLLPIEIEYPLTDEIFVFRLHHILLGLDVFLLGQKIIKLAALKKNHINEKSPEEDLLYRDSFVIR